jgi:hypothetical protein
MPYGDGRNRAWILGELGQRIRPDWNKQQRRWEIAREHLWVLTEAMADRFGEVDLYMEFSNTEKCDARCRNAVSTDVSECVCSCGGDYHGGRAERRDWKLSGATTLISTGDTKERHIVIRRGDRLTRPEVLDLPPPERISEPAPTWVEPTPQPSLATPPAADIRMEKPGRGTGPAAVDPSQSEALPPGCGVAALVVVVAVFGVLALAVHGLFWIGAALAVVIYLLSGAEGPRP